MVDVGVEAPMCLVDDAGDQSSNQSGCVQSMGV
jgi:hypothetical protein